MEKVETHISFMEFFSTSIIDPNFVSNLSVNDRSFSTCASSSPSFVTRVVRFYLDSIANSEFIFRQFGLLIANLAKMKIGGVWGAGRPPKKIFLAPSLSKWRKSAKITPFFLYFSLF